MNKDRKIIINGESCNPNLNNLTDEQVKENRLLMILRGTDHFDYEDYAQEVFTHEIYEDIVSDGRNNMQSYSIIKDFRSLYTEEELNADREEYLKYQLEQIKEDNSLIYQIKGETQLKKALLLLLNKNDKPKRRTLNLIRQRISENEIWIDEFEYEDWVKNPEKSLRNAISNFLNTEEGTKAINDSCNDFNWGDAINSVPESILNKYGLHYIIDKTNLTDVIVNQDEVLFD